MPRVSSSAFDCILTFRDVVEAFAAENGIEFVPRYPSRYGPAGEPVFSFGGRDTYLSSGVLFVKEKKSLLAAPSAPGKKTQQRWDPMSLEQALELVKSGRKEAEKNAAAAARARKNARRRGAKGAKGRAGGGSAQPAHVEEATGDAEMEDID